MSRTTDTTQEGTPARSTRERSDVQTIPELGAEMRALRYELRGYVERHERELERLRIDVQINSEWRLARQAQESVLRWLIGSNLAALVGLAIAIIALLDRAP